MQRLDHYWYDKNLVALALLPLSWLFRLVSALRRAAYRHGLLKVHRLAMPVIVVGNISVGGSGKTPLVIWLAQFLRSRGFTPGIVSRGYGGAARDFPQAVHADTDPALAGDEAVLLAQRCRCPVVIDPDRVRAARSLDTVCDIIISDDGLQHYALDRSIDIAVIDAGRGFGNGYCLPAGPLRELPARLEKVDLLVNNGPLTPVATRQVLQPGIYAMQLVEQGIVNLPDGAVLHSAARFQGKHVHAVAGIGDPARFFTHLEKLGMVVTRHPFPDHHAFTASDLEFAPDLPVIMTEKDAVKCRRFADSRHWFMPVQAQLPDSFGEHLITLLENRLHGQKAA